MMKEKAKVIAVEDDNIVVQSTVKSTCSTCHQVDSCGSGQVAKALPHKTLTTSLECHDQKVIVGDEVVIGIPEKDILQTAWQVYLWPLIGLISCAALGQWLIIHQYLKYELLAIVFAIAGGYLGFKLAQYKQKLRNDKEWLAPKLLSVVGKNIPVTQIQTK